MFAKNIVTRGGDKFRDEYSLAFDGTNDYIVVGDDSSLDITCLLYTSPSPRDRG